MRPSPGPLQLRPRLRAQYFPLADSKPSLTTCSRLPATTVAVDPAHPDHLTGRLNFENERYGVPTHLTITQDLIRQGLK